jgi:hypothetical protein
VKSYSVAILAAIIVLGCLAFYVWPTLYRYDHLKLGANDYPIRTNRLSSDTEIFFPGGWVKREPSVNHPEVELDPWEIVALQVTGRMDSDSVEIKVYNGSKSIISEVSVSISVFDSTHNPLIDKRVYRLTPSYPSMNLSPQSSGEFSARTGLDFRPPQTWEFNVVGAKGRSE